MCLIVGDPEDPVVAVRFEDRKAHSRDSGYRLFTEHAPPLEELGEDDFNAFCFACTNKRHPEAKHGFALAKAYGYAYWDDEEGAWLAEDDEGNEILFDFGDELTASELDEGEHEHGGE
jgi:hypothetical protein